MSPFGEHPYYLIGDLASFQKHLECLMTNDRFRFFSAPTGARRGYPEGHATYLCCYGNSRLSENVAVRIESEEVTEHLHSDNRAGCGFIAKSSNAPLQDVIRQPDEA